MEHDLTDIAEDRLRAARPAAADVDPDAFDAALLARVVASPVAAPARRRRRLTLPAAGLAALGIAAAVVLVGGPAPRRDSAAAAVQRAATWFALPPGRILHYREVFTGRGGEELTQEVWQSTDDPAHQRRMERTHGVTAELAGASLYDPARDTIYDYVPPSRDERVAGIRQAFARKIAAARAAGASRAVRRMRAVRDRLIRQTMQGGRPGLREAVPVVAVSSLGDWSVEQVHRAFDAGRATAGPEQEHDGVDARPIRMPVGKADEGARWVLWTAVDDGRPLELTTDHGPGTPVVEATRFSTYELLPDTDADRLLTLEGAHPGAQMVRASAAYRDAEQRLFPQG